jgi:adenosylmethionine-8-amino-7-oxononanoate aminotransferase
VEIALKIAHQYWQHCGQENRSKFVHLDQAYHGDTLGAVSVGGIDLFHQTFAPLTFSSISTPTPNAYKGHSAEEDRDRCLDLLDQILTRHQGQISGIIVEPLVQGAGGMIIHPAGFLKGVEQLARKYDVLLIVDEVMTGLGRTGQMWACQQEQVEPDILCSAKGLTAGYLPLAATLTTEKIYTAFLGEYAELKTFFHGHSFTGNQLGATVALANLELFDSPDFLSQLENKIAYFQQRLQDFHTLDYVGNLRSIGLIGAFELMSDKRKQIEFPFEQKAGIRVCRSALKKGVVLRPLVNTIVLMPPLSITTSEIDLLIDGVWSAVNQTGRELVAETQLLRHN